MGLWKEVGKAIVDDVSSKTAKIQKMNDEAEDKYIRFSSYSDEELKRKLRGNVTDRAAASKLLRERGYGQ